MTTRGRPIGSCLPPEQRKTRVNFTLPPELAHAFRAYCEREDLRMSTLVAEMIAERIEFREAAE